MLKILNPLYIVLFSVCITGCNHHKREVTGTGNVADPVVNTQPRSLKEVEDTDDSSVMLQPSMQCSNTTDSDYSIDHQHKYDNECLYLASQLICCPCLVTIFVLCPFNA